MDVNPNQLLNIPKNMERFHTPVWRGSICSYGRSPYARMEGFHIALCVYERPPMRGGMGAVGINKSTGERQVTPRRAARWPACRWQSSVLRRWG